MGIAFRLCSSTSFWRTPFVKTLHDHHTFISIDGRPICSQRFADDIDLIANTSRDGQDLTNQLQTACEMKTRTDKNKVMVTGRDKTETYLNGVLLEEVKSFQYLGAILWKHGSSLTNIHIFNEFNSKCLRRLLRISYREHHTSEFLKHNRHTRRTPATPACNILVWFGHVAR